MAQKITRSFKTTFATIGILRVEEGTPVVDQSYEISLSGDRSEKDIIKHVIDNRDDLSPVVVIEREVRTRKYAMDIDKFILNAELVEDINDEEEAD